ncbi:MAG: zinc-dependent metalloprotease family protein, partial [Pseudomonadota bacterium]
MPNHFTHASVLAFSLLASGALAQEAVLFAPIPETADLTPTVADAIARIRSEPLTADVRIVELDSAAFGSEIMTFDTGLEKFGAMTFNSPDLQALDGGAIPDDFRDFSWAGRTVADDAESIIYVDPDGSVSGTVFSDDGSYEIRPVAGGLHAIIEIDDGAIPPEHPEGQLPFEEGGLAPDPVPDSDTAAVDTVDILIAFTTEAAARYPNVRAQANLIIASANRVYQRTGIATRVSLAEAAIVAYDESDSMRTDLSRLRKTSDGHLDGLHDLRDDTSADLVHLIVDREDFCGLAYV